MAPKEIIKSSGEDPVVEPSLPKKAPVRPLSLVKPRAERTISDHVRNYSLEVLAIVLWLYATMKVLIFDLDVWILNSFFPSYEWLLSFRLIFFFALVSAVWLWVGTRDAIVWFFYILFYPLVLLLIRLPIFILKRKSWVLALGISNAIAGFFANLRYRVVFITIFLFAFAAVAFSDTRYLLGAAALVLVILILTTYIKTFIDALKPSTIFRMYSKFFSVLHKTGRTTFSLDDEIRNIPIEELEPHQIEKWKTSLEISVLFNRFCLFAAKKLRSYQKSEWRMIPSVFGLFALVIFTVVSFSGVYVALFKLDSGMFRYTEDPSWFTFLYFSFNNFVLNTTEELAPAVPLAQGAYMLQASLSFFLGVLLVTFYISHRTQKSSSELDEVISAVEMEGHKMEAFIHDEYKIPSIHVAMERLKEVKSGLVQIIYWLSKGP
ncbi:conserved membrane hypothetical protein [Thiocapsa sp. KS1]|nr:hypothetical protein [Thiocapsa sp. KS1]CRI66962.1 conserved membrane hypothetical protein [Thiocapsa sp. KS1]